MGWSGVELNSGGAHMTSHNRHHGGLHVVLGQRCKTAHNLIIKDQKCLELPVFSMDSQYNNLPPEEFLPCILLSFNHIQRLYNLHSSKTSFNAFKKNTEHQPNQNTSRPIFTSSFHSCNQVLSLVLQLSPIPRLSSVLVLMPYTPLWENLARTASHHSHPQCLIQENLCVVALVIVRILHGTQRQNGVNLGSVPDEPYRQGNNQTILKWDIL